MPSPVVILFFVSCIIVVWGVVVVLTVVVTTRGGRRKGGQKMLKPENNFFLWLSGVLERITSKTNFVAGSKAATDEHHSPKCDVTKRDPPPPQARSGIGSEKDEGSGISDPPRRLRRHRMDTGRERK